MKLKASKKTIKENSNNIISIGYCALQCLLRYKEPFAYSSGSMGWACDYYDIAGVILSTGYNPIGEKVDYELVREYEAKAQSIAYGNYIDSYEVKIIKMDILLSEFIKQVKAGK